MTPEEFKRLYPFVIGSIRQTLAAHSGQARAVSSLGFARLPSYFSAAILTATKVVVTERVPVPPLSSMGLSRFVAFERGDYEGITYLNTFFVKRRSADAERLYFHELIHVIQWQLLGPETFLATYAAGLEAFGYRDSPLEAMAYDAEAAFCKSQAIFDAEKLVGEKMGQIVKAAH